MAFINGLQVSKISNSRAAAGAAVTQLPLGELGISEVLPRYSSIAQSGMIFTAFAGAVATAVAGGANVGLQLWNRSQTVNLHLLKCSGDIIVSSATTTGIALAYGYQATPPTAQQTAVVTNNFLGGANPAALALTNGTFTTAPVVNWQMMHNTAAIATSGEDAGFQIDLEGSIIVPPNYYVAIVAQGAAVAAGGSNLELMWVEVPI